MSTPVEFLCKVSKDCLESSDIASLMKLEVRGSLKEYVCALIVCVVFPCAHVCVCVCVN